MGKNIKSSVDKGDVLENAAADLLKKLLSTGDFFLPEKHSKLFQKKKYYSETRKADVIFDIAIETTMPGASTYSLLTLIECKNYGRSISVEKIEAFESKVRSIGEHNTKAIFISNNVLQSGAYQTAVSKKMGIIRLFSPHQYEWINYRKKRDFSVDLDEAEHMFTDETYKSSGFVGVLNSKVFDNIPDLLIEGGVMDRYVHKEKFINVPYISDEYIDKIVERLDKRNIRFGAMLEMERFCDFLSTVYPVTFDFDSILAPGILGKITFDPLRIFITAPLKADEHKWRFTLAHEISHLILHKNLLDGIAEKIDTEESLIFSSTVGRGEINRIEYQANLLASNLLLPKNEVVKVVGRYFKLNNIYKPSLFLDHQPVNQQLVMRLVHNVMEAFGVSASVAKIRLIGLGLINDKSDMSIRGILRNRR